MAARCGVGSGQLYQKLPNGSEWEGPLSPHTKQQFLPGATTAAAAAQARGASPELMLGPRLNSGGMQEKLLLSVG